MKLNYDKNTYSFSKLTWACRRGMLELDVLLGNFLKEAYSTLDERDQNHFITLLHAPDPDIFAWIMGHELAEDPEMARIAEKVRLHALSRT